MQPTTRIRGPSPARCRTSIGRCSTEWPATTAAARVESMAVIEAIELRRTYRTTTGVIRRRPLEVEAVQGISFAVEQGELFGLLGPNAAGKTTTIKMLITLLLPTSGQARVLGHNVVDNPREVR